jgi:hypothetical protein
MTTKRELAELRDRIKPLIFMPEISAEEARLRIAAIFEFGGYIPDDDSGGLFERLCQQTGVSLEEGRRVRECTSNQADVEDWPDRRPDAARSKGPSPSSSPRTAASTWKATRPWKSTMG